MLSERIAFIVSYLNLSSLLDPRAFCRKTAILSPVQQLLIFKVVGCQAFL